LQGGGGGGGGGGGAEAAAAAAAAAGERGGAPSLRKGEKKGAQAMAAQAMAARTLGDTQTYANFDAAGGASSTSEWLSGEIFAARVDKEKGLVYDVCYPEWGELELDVPPARVSRINETMLSVGTYVKVDWGGYGTWSEGRILRRRKVDPMRDCSPIEGLPADQQPVPIEDGDDDSLLPPAMRCGPDFNEAMCFSTAFCNEEYGWCGDTEGHKTAQFSTKYDRDSIPKHCNPQYRGNETLVDTLYDIWFFGTKDVETLVPRTRIQLMGRITPADDGTSSGKKSSSGYLECAIAADPDSRKSTGSYKVVPTRAPTTKAGNSGGDGRKKAAFYADDDGALLTMLSGAQRDHSSALEMAIHLALVGTLSAVLAATGLGAGL
jgi:hypothetical protein